MSRVIWSRAEVERDGAADDATLCFPFPLPRPDTAGPAPNPASGDASFEALFRLHYGPLRELLTDRRAPGLAVLVARGERLEATAWLDARAEEIHSLILGRHSSCDLFLQGDEALSLRHLALVLHRTPVGGGPLRFRVCDLHTPSGFQDEERRPLEAVETEGPLLLRCASFSILLFPTSPDALRWPREASEAWLRVPERTYVEATEGDACRQRSPARAAADASCVERTLAVTFPGPRFASRQLDPEDPAQGELLIETPGDQAAIAVGPRAARSGILLGRYERCAGAGLPLLGCELSRVHTLVIELEGELLAIDTCSKNGTWAGSRPVRSLRLRPGTTLMLARDTRVSWRPFH